MSERDIISKKRIRISRGSSPDNSYPSKVLFVCALFLAAILIFSAPSVLAQVGISGSIKDAQGQPMISANVLLLHPNDSTLIKGVISDIDGKFHISEVKQGDYLLSASMIGYVTLFQPLSFRGQDLEVPGLILKEDVQQLGEVVVQTSKPPFEQHLDKLVVNVQSSIINAGSSVLDVLRRTPGVVINEQSRTINMNGKENVMVMMNGKLTRMPISVVIQMLSGMNADQVETIEIISTPPAKYEAEGNAGLINIVSRHNTEYGTNGTVSANIGYRRYETTGASFNLNHKREKFSVFMDYAESYNRYLMLIENERVEDDGTSKQGSISDMVRDIRLWNHNLRTGLSLKITPKTSITTQFSAFSDKNNQVVNGKTDVRNSVPDSKRIDIKDYETNHLWNYTASLNLHHEFAKNKILSADLDYLNYFNESGHRYLFTYHGTEPTPKEERMVNDKDTPISMWVGKLDYEHSFSSGLQLEAGVKSFWSDIENDIDTEINMNGIWIEEPGMTQHILMSENINSAYVNASTKIGNRNSIQTGLRYEYTHTRMNEATGEPILQRKYGNFFPSLSFQHEIDQNNKVQISYGRRITRPTFNDLAPYFSLVDPNNLLTGNMELLPSYSHNLQASYQLKSYLFSLDFSHVRDPIFWIMKYDVERELQIGLPENMESMFNLSLSASFPNRFAEWWEGQTTLQGTHQKLIAEQGLPHVQRTALQYFTINSTQNLKLRKNFSAEISGYYQSSMLMGNNLLRPTGSLNLGLQKSFQEGRSTLKISGEDLLWTQRWVQESFNEETNVNILMSFVRTTRLVRLTFTHNFGKSGIKTGRRGNSSEEERNRLGI